MAATKFHTTSGTALVSQTEEANFLTHRVSHCHSCFEKGWLVDLKRCTGCGLVSFCSKTCQKAAWPRHKRLCHLVQGKEPPNVFLSSYPQDQALTVIIDSYRLRAHTDCLHRHEDHGIHKRQESTELPADNVFIGTKDAHDDFQRYLDLAEKANILPAWWCPEKRFECDLRACYRMSDDWILAPIQLERLIPRYGGDTRIMAALAILGEKVVGYEGKGPTDNEWFAKYKRHWENNVDGNRERLMQQSLDSTRRGLEQHGVKFPLPPRPERTSS
jgi:hypothetical protein